MTTILVVDDSAVDRRLAGGILEKHGDLTIEYAKNGADALAKIAIHVPDLVLTDLQMDEIDGLELVGTIRAKWPLVPVILMTAHGSEEIAVQALHRGAASYVPKTKLALDLVDTVDAVLAVTRADRHHERLIECLAHSDSTFILDNDSTLIHPLVDHLQQMVMGMRFCDETGRIRLGIALEEALVNALYHGNLEITSEELREARSGNLQPGSISLVDQRRRSLPYLKRRIHVNVRITPSEAKFVIGDDGPGFNPSDVPDPTDPANLERESGRGLLLMRTFMDEIKFNPQGNQVTMIKRRDATNGQAA